MQAEIVIERFQFLQGSFLPRHRSKPPYLGLYLSALAPAQDSQSPIHRRTHQLAGRGFRVALAEAVSSKLSKWRITDTKFKFLDGLRTFRKIFFFCFQRNGFQSFQDRNRSNRQKNWADLIESRSISAATNDQLGHVRTPRSGKIQCVRTRSNVYTANRFFFTILTSSQGPPPTE